MLIQSNYPITVVGNFFIVGNNYHRSIGFFIELLNKLHNFRFSLGIQCTRRLIRQKQNRLTNQSIPNGLILLFGVFLRGRMYPKWFVFLIWDTFLIRIVSQSCYFKDLGCF